MNRLLSTILLSAVFSSQLVFGEDGFIDKSGRMVIEPRFEAAFSFSEGLAGIRSGKKFGFIDKEGTVKIAPQFDEISSFRNGLARVRTGASWGYIDTTGKMIIAPQFFEGRAFSEGLAMVRRSGGKPTIGKDSFGREGTGILIDPAGYIDKTGTMVIELNSVRPLPSVRVLHTWRTTAQTEA